MPATSPHAPAGRPQEHARYLTLEGCGANKTRRTETIDTGPFFLKGKKNKIVSAKGGGSETRKMKAHSGFYHILLVYTPPLVNYRPR